MDEQEPQCPIMPDFWLMVKICQDKVVVYSHSRYVQHSLSVQLYTSNGHSLIVQGRRHSDLHLWKA